MGVGEHADWLHRLITTRRKWVLPAKVFSPTIAQRDATPFRALSPHNAHPQAHLRRDDAGAVGVVIGGITSTTTDGVKGKRL